MSTATIIVGLVAARDQGMSPDVIAAGVFGIAGAVVGAVVGTVGGVVLDRWVRRRGEVRCEIDDWTISAGTPLEPESRLLEVAFWNAKELPVTVSKMRVEFYKGGEPLQDWVRPGLLFVDLGGRREELKPVNVPPRVAISRTIRVTAGRHDIRRELATADRAEFVASVIGAQEIRKQLPQPWREVPVQSG